MVAISNNRMFIMIIIHFQASIKLSCLSHYFLGSLSGSNRTEVMLDNGDEGTLFVEIKKHTTVIRIQQVTEKI